MGLKKIKEETSSPLENLKAVTRTKLHEQIILQIQNLIEQGCLKHGDQLPPERKLAEIFKVSRHSVREAIRILEQRGILITKPGSGTFLIMDDKKALADFLSRAIHNEKNKLSEIFEFRRIIEPKIAGLAAKNANPSEIEKIQELLSEQMNSVNDPLRSKELDQEFHLALAKASGNSILIHVIELLTDILSICRSEMSQTHIRREQSIEGHKKIFEAVKKGDSMMAQEKMEDHLRIIEQIVITS